MVGSREQRMTMLGRRFRTAGWSAAVPKCPDRLRWLRSSRGVGVVPMMAAPRESCVVNSPNNRVQETIQNRNGDTYSYSSEELCKYFKQGKRLSLSKIPFGNIACPHQEIDILKGLE